MVENNFVITKVHNVLNEILNPSVYELNILLRYYLNYSGNS